MSNDEPNDIEEGMGNDTTRSNRTEDTAKTAGSDGTTPAPKDGSTKGKSATGPSDAKGATPKSAASDPKPKTEDDQIKINRRKIMLEGTKLFERKTHFSLCKHKLSAIHLRNLHFVCFKLTMAIITLVSGILAFLASLGGDGKTGNDAIPTTTLNVIVGILSFILVFIQNLASHFNWDSRAQMHGGTEVDLRDLLETLDIAVDRGKILVENGANGMAVFKDEDNDGVDDVLDNVFQSYMNKYSQCLTGCKSTVPVRINNAFTMLDSELQALFSYAKRTDNDKDSTDSKLKKRFGESYESVLCFKACDLLVAKFIQFKRWPFALPRDPKKLVEQTLDELTKMDPKEYENKLIMDPKEKNLAK